MRANRCTCEALTAMRTVWLHVSVIGLCLTSVVAARGVELQQVDDLAPTPLEAFAARPGAKVVWSSTIGQLDGPQARATVVALAIEDASSTPGVMRGVRIDLAHLEAEPDCNLIYRAWAILCARANAAVYLEEDRLERVRAGVERGAAEVHRGNFISVFRRGGRQPGSGLIICGYTLEGRQPEELVALLARATAAWRDAPR